MSRVYNAYMSEEERSYAVENAMDDLQFARYNVMLSMIDQKLDLNKKAAELKVLKESGTYEDLEYLYTEAENEANQEKTGVIQSVVNAIKNVLKSISNAIKNFVGGKRDPNEIIEVDSNEWDNSNKLISGWNKVTSALNQSDDKNGNKVKAVIAAVGGLLGSIAIVKGGNIVYKKVKYGDIKNQVTKIDEIQQSITNFLNNSIIGPLSQGLQWVKDFFGGGKKKDENTDNKDGNTENKDTNGNADGTDNANLGVLTNLVKRIREMIQGFKIPFGKNKANNAQGENQPEQKTDTNEKKDQTEDKGSNGENAGTEGNGDNTGTTESVEDLFEENDDIDDNVFGLNPEDFVEESGDDSLDEIMEILRDL